MPAGDGTGPLGLGGMTGRGAGYCAGFPMPGYMNPMPGRGWGMGRGWGRGRGRGRGRGWGHGYYPTGGLGAVPFYGVGPYYAAPSAEHEMQALRSQAQHLEGTLDEIRKRIAELETTQQKEA
jgi:hypothetical protein